MKLKVFVGNNSLQELKAITAVASRYNLEFVEHADESDIIISDWEPDHDPRNISRSFVTPDWIKAMCIHGKYYDPKYYSAHPKKIFSGFIVHCDTEVSDSDIIYGGVAALGGQYRMEFDMDVTHYIVCNWKPRLKALLETGMLIITPEYFDDCFRLGLKCNDSHYVYPDPIIYTHDILSMMEMKCYGKLVAEYAEIGEHPKDEIPGCDISELVFIDSNVEGTENLLEFLESFGCSVCTVFDDATVVIVDEQNQTYEDAIAFGKRFGTQRWAKDQFLRGQKLCCTKSVLYHPVPTVPIVEFQKFHISVTNYVGEARKDICLMAIRMGAKVSSNLTTSNTHLICAAPIGKKYERATKWNIHTVNHLWLEECYSKWSYLAEGNPKYLHFISSLGNMVGKTSWVSGFCPIGKENQVVPPAKRELAFHEDRESKKRKGHIKILLTGINTMSPKIVALTEILHSLGVSITTDFNDFDYLIAKKLSHTEKMLVAISKGKPILSLAWLEGCSQDSKMLDIDQYWLKSSTIDLKDVVRKAQTEPLFKNHYILISHLINPSASTFESIIHASGGTCSVIDSFNTANRLMADHRLSSKVICICNSSEKNTASFLLSSLGLYTYSAESFLNSVLRQEPIENFQHLD